MGIEGAPEVTFYEVHNYLTAGLAVTPPTGPSTFGGIRALKNLVLDLTCVYAERIERAVQHRDEVQGVRRENCFPFRT